MQENNTMETKIKISTDKSVLLTGNVLETIKLEEEDFLDYYEGGKRFLSHKSIHRFLPEDYQNEELLYFEAIVDIRIVEQDGRALQEKIELENIKGYTAEQIEVSLTKEEYQQAYTLIENALEF